MVPHEDHRSLGNGGFRLGGVVAVVRTDADDFSGAYEGRADAQAIGVEFGQEASVDRRTGPLQGQIRQHAAVGADSGSFLAGIADA